MNMMNQYIKQANIREKAIYIAQLNRNANAFLLANMSILKQHFGCITTNAQLYLGYIAAL